MSTRGRWYEKEAASDLGPFALAYVIASDASHLYNCNTDSKLSGKVSYQETMGLGCPLTFTEMITSCPSTTHWSHGATFKIITICQILKTLPSLGRTCCSFIAVGKFLLPEMREVPWSGHFYFGQASPQAPSPPPEGSGTPRPTGWDWWLPGTRLALEDRMERDNAQKITEF